ncbi:MAG: transposase [Myxococcota bacterium]
MALRSHGSRLGARERQSRPVAWLGALRRRRYGAARPRQRDDSLTVVDRNFLAAPVLIPLQKSGTNRHWLTRAIDYQRKGFRPQRLLTSLLDAKAYPASEIIELYHERWEIELAYREIKTDVLDGAGAPLRSKRPEGVRQEVWGVLLAYNLIRLEIERMADEAKVKPTRISFAGALNLICDEWMWLAGTRTPGQIPRQLKRLRADMRRLVLPKRRRERSYPRAVKIKMSNYAKKRA